MNRTILTVLQKIFSSISKHGNLRKPSARKRHKHFELLERYVKNVSINLFRNIIHLHVAQISDTETTMRKMNRLTAYIFFG